jgi:hypothetical protein
MDLNLRKILLEYKEIDYNKNQLNKSIINEDYNETKKIADSAGFSGTDKLANLNQNFYPVVARLFNLLQSNSCKARISSGHRNVMTNTKSLHPQGRAIDIVFTSNIRSCVGYMTKICSQLNSEFPGVYCMNEYPSMGGKKSKDWSGDHYHIQFSGNLKDGGETKGSSETKTDYGSSETKTDSGSLMDYLPDLSSDASSDSFAGLIGKSLLKNIMDDYNPTHSLMIDENFNFGRKVIDNGYYYIIPSLHNTEIRTPISGIASVGRSSNCPNQVIIKNSAYMTKLQYCNLGEKSVNDGDRVSENQVIGKADPKQDVSVMIIPLGTNKTTNVKSKNKNNDDKDYEKEQARQRLRRSGGDPVTHFLVSWPFDLYRYMKKKKKEKSKENESKINENIQRIKKLL